MALKLLVVLTMTVVLSSSSLLPQKDDFSSQDDCFIFGLQYAGQKTKVNEDLEVILEMMHTSF